jgi:hypothetical protein
MAQTKKSKKAPVLFQKLGNHWYVFSQVGDEVIYSPLPAHLDPRQTKLELYEVIDEHLKRVAKFRRARMHA